MHDNIFSINSIKLKVDKFNLGRLGGGRGLQGGGGGGFPEKVCFFVKQPANSNFFFVAWKYFEH